MTVASAVERSPFGELLRAHRKHAGLTQERLAELAGYSTVYVSMLEQGRRLPQPDTLAAFALALGLGPRDKAALETSSNARESNSSTSSIIVGRLRERYLIDDHLKGNGSPVVMLAGEPGIGKTSLLRYAADRARQDGLPVLEGGCLRRGGERPFTPLLQAIQSYISSQGERRVQEDLSGCAWLVRLLPELVDEGIESLPAWDVPPDQERRLMDDAVVRFFGNVARGERVALVLDDLQWAAADALEMISMVVQSKAPVKLLGAYRENEVSDAHPFSLLLGDLAHKGLIEHVSIGPLDISESQELLTELVGTPEGMKRAQLQQVIDRADGVPFFLVSWARGIDWTAPPGDGDSADVPWSVRQTVRQRLAMLPQPARDVLDWASIAGRSFTQTLIREAAGLRSGGEAEGLDEACQAGLLESRNAREYGFVHDVVREVVEADLGGARRISIHQRLGEILEGAGGTVETLAYHFAHSDDDAKACRYLRLAGEAAEAQHANAAAEGYFRELIDRLQASGMTSEGALAWERLAHVLTLQGKYPDALSALENCNRCYQAQSDSEGEARCAAQAGRIHYLRGSPSEGVAVLQAARQRLGMQLETAGAARIHAALAPLHLIQGEYREQLARAEAAGRIARELDDRHRLSEAEVWRGCALNQMGDLDAGWTVLEKGLQLAEEIKDLSSAVHATNDLGYLSQIGGELERSRAYRVRALEIARELGDQAAIANMLCRCGQVDYLIGDWSEARSSFEESLEIARDVGAASVVGYPTFGLGLLSLAVGDEEAVKQLAAECIEIGAETSDEQIARAGIALQAASRLRLRDGHAAYNLLAPYKDGGSGLPLHSMLPLYAHACVLTARVTEATELIDAGLAKAEQSRNRLSQVELLRVKAMERVQRKDSDGALSVVASALDVARNIPYPLLVSLLLDTRADAYRLAGRKDHANSAEHEAAAILEELRSR